MLSTVSPWNPIQAHADNNDIDQLESYRMDCAP